MNGKVRQAAQKALSFARIIQMLKATYLTAFICLLCVAIGFALGTMNTLDMAKASIAELQHFTRAAILESRK